MTRIMNKNLIILAGGASSRMKKEATSRSLSTKAIEQANTRSKGLIEIGHQNLPFLHYLLFNARKAGFTNVFIVIGPQDTLFQQVYGSKEKNNVFNELQISFVRQHIPKGRTKPYGTADAVFQALEQYPELQKSSFVVCNCDNLYSIQAFNALREEKTANALLGYDREGLLYPPERIAKFALMKTDSDGFLVDIIEKPSAQETSYYFDSQGKLRVSMNIFKFNGELFYPFLRDCPPHPERDEKELPTALLNMVNIHSKSVKVIPHSEHVIDLTSKDDIETVSNYLEEHHPNGVTW